MQPIKLNDQEKMQSAWIVTKSVINSRLESLSKKLESNLSEIETANSRGRIAELRKLLDIESPVIETDADYQ